MTFWKIYLIIGYLLCTTDKDLKNCIKKKIKDLKINKGNMHNFKLRVTLLDPTTSPQYYNCNRCLQDCNHITQQLRYFLKLQENPLTQQVQRIH